MRFIPEFLDKHIDNISLFSVITFMLLAFSQVLSPYLADEEAYIRESEEMRLDDYEFVGHEFWHHALHPDAHTYTIQAGGRYYAFYYYQKSKNDHSHYSLSNNLNRQGKVPLYFPVHPSETGNGRGTRDNPVHVLNYGTEPGAYRWDDRSYRHNIGRDAFCRKILRCGTIGNGFYHALSLSALLALLFLLLIGLKRRSGTRPII